ncbi:hypothetical protein EEB14_08595 [Rhodococcus sp. WS4]|nr:hypothetical protein EEB14_08595 [Rhodococcus sp. WS4]
MNAPRQQAVQVWRRALAAGEPDTATDIVESRGMLLIERSQVATSWADHQTSLNTYTQRPRL